MRRKNTSRFHELWAYASGTLLPGKVVKDSAAVDLNREATFAMTNGLDLSYGIQIRAPDDYGL
jgi:hypothetical protein